jgi:hypothetical protein
MDLMADRGAVAVRVKEQSVIFKERRKRRRELINSVHAEVRDILNSDLPSSLTVAEPKKPLPLSKV